VCERYAKFVTKEITPPGCLGLTADQPSSLQPTDECLLSRSGCAGRVSLLASPEEVAMARKIGQIIARGDGRLLIRVYLGRDHETKKRRDHNRTI